MSNEIATEDESEIFDGDLDIEELLQRLLLCKNVTENIIVQLDLLKGTIVTHRGAVLKAKTSGTTVTTIGTGLAVTGLILAPFTFGVSLIVSSIGAVTTVGGAATNMIADLVDHSKRKKYLQNIQKLADEQQSPKLDLAHQLTHLQELIDPFLSKGLSKCEAVYAALINGDRYNESSANGSNKGPDDDEFEWIEDTQGKWKPVKTFAFKASIQSLKLVKSSQALSALTIAGRTGASTASNVSVSVGRLLGTAVFKTAMAAVGVIFTSIDIALLVREWKASDPTQETVNFVRGEFENEVKQIVELIELLETVKRTKFFRGMGTGVGCRVVGNSPFSVNAMTALLNGNEELVVNYYGVVLQIDKKWVGDEWCQSCWVGLGKGDDTWKLGQDSLLNTEENLRTEPVTEIHQIFPSGSKDQNGSRLEIHVIDQSVLRLNAVVIDAFLTAKRLPGFDTLKKLLGSRHNCSVLQDYDEPLPPNVVMNIRDVCVAYVKCGSNDGYINANKWEYELILEMVVKTAVAYFCKVYDEYSANEDLGGDQSESEQMSDMVEVLINHQSFLDPVAFSVWKSNNSEKNVKLLEDIVSSVSDLFRNLRFRIPMWVCDLCDI